MAGNRQDLSATRRALHGVAELVLAGPEYRASQTIRLRPVQGGFATLRDPALRVENGNLVGSHGSVPINGRSCADLAAAMGVNVGAPADLYHDGSGVAPNEVLAINPELAALIIDGFDMGDAALRQFAPDQSAVLWPEHFDLSVTVDEVNYGVSPGDTYLDEPYAYVGPRTPREDPFFNAPFGAAQPLRALPTPAALTTFFATGRDLATA